MIKGLASGSKYTVVSGGNTSVPYVNQNTNNPIQGMVRISGSDLQVFDGASWIVMNTSYTTVGLTSEAESLLDWARKKRNEEMERDLLAATNPTIKDLLEQIKEKEDQIQMVMNLIQKEVGESTLANAYGAR
jgi:hypothetical protein